MTEEHKRAFIDLYSKNRDQKTRQYNKWFKSKRKPHRRAKTIKRKERYRIHTHKTIKDSGKLKMPKTANGKPLRAMGWAIHYQMTGMRPEDYRPQKKVKKTYPKET